MKLSRAFRFVAASALLAFAVATGASPNGKAAVAPETAEQNLSTRIVAYVIDAKLDTEKHTITATESVKYRNLTGQPLQVFPFHLYLNAFQPHSVSRRSQRGQHFAGHDG